ncbi:hypothetical protein [Actinomadura atramentaria]|uniref:hypothetical protein n=1 Tax=Actinomadura atramentaria TaxID=1990 RepID=UPI00036577CF|nr:hypothetical protein [Actinomadura atramentaria]
MSAAPGPWPDEAEARFRADLRQIRRRCAERGFSPMLSGCVALTLCFLLPALWWSAAVALACIGCFMAGHFRLGVSNPFTLLPMLFFSLGFCAFLPLLYDRHLLTPLPLLPLLFCLLIDVFEYKARFKALGGEPEPIAWIPYSEDEREGTATG